MVYHSFPSNIAKNYMVYHQFPSQMCKVPWFFATLPLQFWQIGPLTSATAWFSKVLASKDIKVQDLLGLSLAGATKLAVMKLGWLGATAMAILNGKMHFWRPKNGFWGWTGWTSSCKVGSGRSNVGRGVAKLRGSAGLLEEDGFCQ